MSANKSGPISRVHLLNPSSTYLPAKALRALDQTGLKTLVVAGGVGANAQLRNRLQKEVSARGGQVFFPPPELCTDNGAMIALAGLAKMKRAQSAAPNQCVALRSQCIRAGRLLRQSTPSGAPLPAPRAAAQYGAQYPRASGGCLPGGDTP